MKKRTTPTLLVITTAFLMTSCLSIKEPELKGIGGLRMNKLSLANPNLSVELFYFNPNNYRLKIKRAEGNAWINGQPLGHFTVDSMVHISALTDFRLPVNLQVDKNHLTENVSTLVLAQEVTLKIEAMAKIGKGLVFINYPIHYEGKQNLREILK